MKIFEVADVASVPAGTMKKVSVEGIKILLANLDGTFYALPDRCPHMGGSLSEGKMMLVNGRIVCPNHGASFDVKTGKNIEGAKTLFVRKKVADIIPYTVQIKGAKVFVQVTDAR